MCVCVCVCVAESFLRKREDDIRIAMQELDHNVYNEDEVISELDVMVVDVGKTRKAIPQCVELQELSVLNAQAIERGETFRRAQVATPMDHRGGVSVDTHSTISSAGDNATRGMDERDSRELVTQARERRNTYAIERGRTYEAQLAVKERSMKRGKDSPADSPLAQNSTSLVAGHRHSGSPVKHGSPVKQGGPMDNTRPRNFVTPPQYNHMDTARNNHTNSGSSGMGGGYGKGSISPVKGIGGGVASHPSSGSSQYFSPHRRPPSFEAAGPQDTTLV